MIETSLLDKIIVGRVEPHIYAFRTNTIPNYLKIGDTYRPVNVRLKEWEQFFPNLEHLDNWKWVAKTQDGKYFRDFAVHYYLEEIKHLHRLQPNEIPNLVYYSREFFKNATPQDIDDAIIEIENNANKVGSPYQFYSEDRLPITETWDRTENYDPRPNQQDTIDNFIKARNNGRRNLLMYAVMRFGKSFTSMCCATKMEAKTVLIVSAKADVKNEWKRTVESHMRFINYTFVDSSTLIDDNKKITNLLKENKRAVVFLTLQDLMGNAIKEKHEDIFKNQIDLLIVDETHFGARADEYGKILREAKLTEKQITKELDNNDESVEQLEEALKLVKKLKIDTTLHLSGTPYRILMGNEFKPEDIIAFYQFTDIIDDKEQWDKDNLINEDIKEWDNPYYGFPQMVRFAFNPNESARKMLEQLKKQGKSASLSELFRPQSISKDSRDKKHLHFVHESEVLDLLRIIDGSQEDDNLLSFLNYDKLKEGKMCRHIVCVLPFRASCDAFEYLIETNKNKFKNLSQYHIVNISGIANNNFTTIEQIKNQISEHEKKGEKTITLTVNRMLTGSTVKEWDTMIFLKDVSSPQEYDQAIFRLQNQYTQKFKNEAGDTISYNMKPQTLLVDFDPNRMFIMQEQKSKIYNVNTSERGNAELEERIHKELKISPIIVINKGKLTEVKPTNIMDAVRNYSSTRTVMEEAREIPTDYTLLQDPQIQLLIENLEPINAQKGINIEPVKGEGDDFNGDDNSDDNSDDTTDTINPNNQKAIPKEIDDADKRLATYFAQILFFALLTDDEVNSLEDIIQVIKNNTDNQRIAHNVGLKISSLIYLHSKLNPFILQDLDYTIHNINERSRDTSLEPLIRVERALKKFGRLSISEIVTPSKVADDIVAHLPDSISKDTKILDIASKQAEFACALYRRFGDSVKNNIVSLPTSSLTYEFTRKVYTLLGLPITNIVSTFNTYDLIGSNQETYKNILKDMKFNTIVGNPPYQFSNHQQIYPYFYQISKKIGKYVTLIFPTGWQEPKNGNNLRILNTPEVKNDSQIRFIDNRQNVFVGVPGAEWVNIIFWQQGYNNNLSGKQNILTNGKNLEIKELLIDKKQIQKPKEIIKLAEIVTKQKDFVSLSTVTSARKPYGLDTKVFDDPLKYRLEKRSKDDIKVYGSKGEIRYIDRNTNFTKESKGLDKYKVFVPYAWGNWSETSGLGGAFSDIIIGLPYEICTEYCLESRHFDTFEEAQKHAKFLNTRFARALLYLNKHSQHSTTAWDAVPFLSYTEDWWNKSILELEDELIKFYSIPENIAKFILEKFQIRDENNIINYNYK